MRLYHIAVYLERLETSSLGPALGGWAGPLHTIHAAAAATPAGPAEMAGRSRRLLTADPAFTILIEDTPAGTPIRLRPDNPWHHVAIWCDDLNGAVRALAAEGHAIEMAGPAAEGVDIYAYMAAPHGPRVELFDGNRRPRIDAHQAAQVAEPIEGIGPLRVIEVGAVLAGRDDLASLAAGWSRALGARWGDIAERTETVVTPDGPRLLRWQELRSEGTPAVVLILPDGDGRSLLAPLADGAWHHVAFASTDLAGDHEALEARGFVTEYRDGALDGPPLVHAMMRAPEGTRIRLVAG